MSSNLETFINDTDMMNEGMHRLAPTTMLAAQSRATRAIRP